jgi:hypothetical protein
MPIDLPPASAAADYAYVVDVRPFDRCVVPHCAIKGRDVTGYKHTVELDGDLGAYSPYGRPGDNELFYRRSKLLEKGETYAFDVPESDAASELDVYLSAAKEGSFGARLRVYAQRNAASPELLVDETFTGTTNPWVNRTKQDQLAHVEEFLKHERVPLPSRKGRTLRVVFENTTDTTLSLGNPLVMKRVEGRGPRQGFIVVFDAVPFYLLGKLFTGTGDPPTEFLHKMTSERGLFFPQGHSPAISTQFFVRRFFRNGYFNIEGEPILRGYDMDEEPPAHSPTTVARFAEQGFLTETFIANVLLNPDVSGQGADGGYQNEMVWIGHWPELYHPAAIATRFENWMPEHAHDDVSAVIWMSTPHDSVRLKMWTDGRKEVAAPLPPTLTKPTEYRAEVVQARWENLLDCVDAVRRIFAATAKYSPNASRLWTLTADHGLIQTNANEPREARYRSSTVHGPQHRFFGASEEAWTPFAVIYDGVARPPHGPQVVQGITMAGAAWRAYEQLFDVSLGLPETSVWDSPSLSPEAYATRWHDDGSFSIGHAGAVRVASGKWGYRSLRPKLWLVPIWDQTPKVQLMLGGSDRRSNTFFSEELYDDEVDPLETRNIAAANSDVVLRMRRRAQDFLSTYHDPKSHPRHRDVLTFSKPLDLVLEGPRPFKVRVDGEDVAMTDPRRVTVHAKRIEITEDWDAMSIVSIKGPGVSAPLLLRCGASGQPLDELSPERDRFDLATARHNCVTSSDASPPEGEVWFSTQVVRSKSAGVSGANGASSQTMEAFRRWGYVRDIDKKLP